MDFKKVKAPTNTVTRDINELAEPTGNIYETVAVIGKRANQISAEMKQEMKKKLDEFQTSFEGAEEVYENREQIEISRFYERLPKPSLIATQEFVDNSVYFRDNKQQSED